MEEPKVFWLLSCLPSFCYRIFCLRLFDVGPLLHEHLNTRNSILLSLDLQLEICAHLSFQT